MSYQFQYLLVIAKSARMLAGAAKRAGLKPIVIDLYNDLDTQEYAEEIYQIPALTTDYLLPIIDYIIDKYAILPVFYGGGFEQYPDSLKAIGRCLTIYGNQPEVFVSLQDKPEFFSVLKKLHIPFPEVSFELPNQDTTWLVKPTRGQGGVGIRRYKCGETSAAEVYWQKYQEGMPHSVLFLADGKLGQVVGFNRQWTTSLNNGDEFIFSGIINSTGLSAEQKANISGWLNSLVPEFSLKGLNSLDFIQFGETSYVLEINPRPPASMQLYDTDLFVRHIKACQGELLDHNYSQQGYSGYQVIYAVQDTQIPEKFDWAEGAVDLPVGGSIISAGQPICSIISHQKQPEAVMEGLQTMQALIIKHTDRFQIHGI